MTTIRSPRPSVSQSLEAEMRPMRLSVTAGHTLEFMGHGHYSPITEMMDGGTEGLVRFATLNCAYDHLRTAEGLTAALMANLRASGGQSGVGRA